MNKRILIGLVISLTVLFLTPFLPTVQLSKAKEANEQMLYDSLGQSILQSLASDEDMAEVMPEGLSDTIINELSENAFFKKIVEKASDSNDGDDPQPLFFPFLGIFVYGLIASIIIKIIAYILHYFGSIIQTIANNIKTRVSNFIQKIMSIIQFIIKVIVTIIQGIINLLIRAGNLVVMILTTIISAVIAVILFLLNVIVAILQRLWQGVGTFMGLMIEIFILIYETIFPPAVNTP
jgi:hypothetical protein